MDKTATPRMIFEPLLNVPQARAVLGISHTGFYRLLERGELEVVKVGARTLVEPDALRAFIKARRTRSLKCDDPASTGSIAKPAGVVGEDATG